MVEQFALNGIGCQTVAHATEGLQRQECFCLVLFYAFGIECCMNVNESSVRSLIKSLRVLGTAADSHIVQSRRHNKCDYGI